MELIYPYDTPEFMEAWNLWLQYRKEIKKSIKGKISAQAQLKKIARISSTSEEAVRVIHQSIENNWQGLFELKNNGSTREQKFREANRQLFR